MADKLDIIIDGKPLSALRVVDLKQELEKRGLSKSGSKKDLLERLKLQLQLEKLQNRLEMMKVIRIPQIIEFQIYLCKMMK
ncbi:apoptotic chromatin condensation inducer in the nucleus-like [Centruroides vittatus]|uniref:apoptotic chromatin condensation inducer in the nucleus-like n=1 Tax=Centruroides vittatus TaxID=120091 RepID=UPI00350EBB94